MTCLANHTPFSVTLSMAHGEKLSVVLSYLIFILGQEY